MLSRLVHASLLLAATSALVPACVDQPNDVTPPGSMRPVRRLSDVGVFVGTLSERTPAPGFVPFDVNVSLYSDGAHKQRLLYLPPGTTVHVTDDRWDLPVGGMLVKTFYFPRDERDPSQGVQAIETRFLVRKADGYHASTYLWNEAQTEAVSSGGNVDVPVHWVDTQGQTHDQQFHVPGTSQCMTCHNDHPLGLRTRQMNRDGEFGDGTTNQIDHLAALGLLDTTPATRTRLVDPFGPAPLHERALSYLDANCGHCHSEQGEAADTSIFWDLEHTQTRLPTCFAVDPLDGARFEIVPGAPEQSGIIAHMQSDDPFERMPRGPTRIPDARGIAMLSEWIRSMPTEVCQ